MASWIQIRSSGLWIRASGSEKNYRPSILLFTNTFPYHGADSSWVIIMENHLISPPHPNKSYRAKKGTILVRIQHGTIKIWHLNIFETVSAIFSCESGAFALSMYRYPLSSELETDVFKSRRTVLGTVHHAKYLFFQEYVWNIKPQPTDPSGTQFGQRKPWRLDQKA